ncbi:unnamed protein product [Vicia faba]|uniref:Importin-7/11-like TPR repeats domain-containing protein n=1 Tax=Vicia faba TaxID=3906 RepID=A0AAV0YEJ6_VICFA|nr:unnamed protein product [Vicia faba]
MWPLLSGGKPVMVVVHDAPIKELTQRTAFICTSHRTLRLKVIHELNQLVEGESLLQIQLLVSLRNIVIALGYQSPIFHNITLPLLENEIDINSPNELSLLEDNMLFWEATLSQAPPMLLCAKLLDPVVGNVNDKGLLSILPVVAILARVLVMSTNSLAQLASDPEPVHECLQPCINYPKLQPALIKSREMFSN